MMPAAPCVLRAEAPAGSADARGRCGAGPRNELLVRRHRGHAVVQDLGDATDELLDLRRGDGRQQGMFPLRHDALSEQDLDPAAGGEELLAIAVIAPAAGEQVDHLLQIEADLHSSARAPIPTYSIEPDAPHSQAAIMQR